MCPTTANGTLAAPATGGLAGIAAGEAYAATPIDPAFDGLVESARPAVQATFDAVDNVVDGTVDLVDAIKDAFLDGDDEGSVLDRMESP